jgi:hypothetical protein
LKRGRKKRAFKLENVRKERSKECSKRTKNVRRAAWFAFFSSVSKKIAVTERSLQKEDAWHEHLSQQSWPNFLNLIWLRLI